MNALEERLSRELRAESEKITPDSIVDLRLPGQTKPALRRRGTQRWPAWAKPLAAAAAVVAVIVGTVAVVRAIPSTTPAAGPSGSYSSAPAYYAYGIQASLGKSKFSVVDSRYIKVRSTATGKLLTTVSPPEPYNDFSLLTAAANDSTFVFGAVRYARQGGRNNWDIVPGMPMKFLMLSITPGGGTQLSTLSLPETLTMGQTATIALSPDGSRLAVAYGGSGQAAVVQVITLATGSTRQWVLPHSSWTPWIWAEGAWAANGRTMAFEWRLDELVMPGKRYGPAATADSATADSTQVRLLDTAAPGTSLASSRLLALHTPAGSASPLRPFLTPAGTELICFVRVQGPHNSRHWSGELAVYSTRTGALLRTLDPWASELGGYPYQIVAWSNFSGSQLIVLQPRNDHYILGVLTGNTFTATRSTLLPRRFAAHQPLQYALRDWPYMTW